MTDKQFLFHIGFKYIMFILFLYFTIDSVGMYGWGFMQFLLALFAARDFVHGTRMAGVYYRFKTNKKP